jgi:hypothetical protein
MPWIGSWRWTIWHFQSTDFRYPRNTYSVRRRHIPTRIFSLAESSLSSSQPKLLDQDTPARCVWKKRKSWLSENTYPSERSSRTIHSSDTFQDGDSDESTEIYAQHAKYAIIGILSLSKNCLVDWGRSKISGRCATFWFRHRSRNFVMPKTTLQTAWTLLRQCGPLILQCLLAALALSAAELVFNSGRNGANNWWLRHAETTTAGIQRPHCVDIVFHSLFSLCYSCPLHVLLYIVWWLIEIGDSCSSYICQINVDMTDSNIAKRPLYFLSTDPNPRVTELKMKHSI